MAIQNDREQISAKGGDCSIMGWDVSCCAATPRCAICDSSLQCPQQQQRQQQRRAEKRLKDLYAICMQIESVRCIRSRCSAGYCGRSAWEGVRYLGSTTASQLRFIVAQQQQQQRGEGAGEECRGGSIDVAESSLNCCQFNGKLNTNATGKLPESDILSLV